MFKKNKLIFIIIAVSIPISIWLVLNNINKKTVSLVIEKGNVLKKINCNGYSEKQIEIITLDKNYLKTFVPDNIKVKDENGYYKLEGKINGNADYLVEILKKIRSEIDLREVNFFNKIYADLKIICTNSNNFHAYSYIKIYNDIHEPIIKKSYTIAHIILLALTPIVILILIYLIYNNFKSFAYKND